MLDKIPNKEVLIQLIGPTLCEVWQTLNSIVDEKYEMETTWSKGGKKWVYEYKYRRGGKTLCAFYAKENCIGFMIVFGKNEREKFEIKRNEFSQIIQKIYDDAETFHDGKWIMFEPVDTSLANDFIHLLSLKRKPNR